MGLMPKEQKFLRLKLPLNAKLGSRTVGALILAVLAVPAHSTEFVYEVLDAFPSLGHMNYFYLSEFGDVMGSVVVNGRGYAAMFSNGKYSYYPYPGDLPTQAIGVRNSKYFVGHCSAIGGGFIYDGGDYIELTTVEGGETVVPTAMSLNGNICGSVRDKMYARVNGIDHTIGILPGYAYSSLRGINNTGLCFGSMDNATSDIQHFFWSKRLGLTLLPTAWGCSDINNKDEYVGWGVADGVTQAILYRDGQAKILGPGVARAVNDNSWVLIQHNLHGYLWRNDTYTELKDITVPGLSYDVIHFADLNNRGQILALVFDFQNKQLTNPRYVMFTPVPEPATYLSFSLSVGWAFCRRRSQK